ncbi:MAG: EthD family reductase [Chloroflexi bacterium]|nr:EthD family reductase [Chloroflexota bacterium]
MKLVAIYSQPEDPEAFDKAYFDTHLPLIEKVPGLQKTVITRFDRTFAGPELYLMAEMYFADKDALKAAMTSPEMVAAGENLDSFAQGMYSLLRAPSEEEK